MRIYFASYLVSFRITMRRLETPMRRAKPSKLSLFWKPFATSRPPNPSPARHRKNPYNCLHRRVSET